MIWTLENIRRIESLTTEINKFNLFNRFKWSNFKLNSIISKRIQTKKRNAKYPK